MASLENIPKYIRYDFFMALFGIFVLYFLFTNDRIYNLLELKILFSVLGAATILYGVFEMKNNYDADKEIQEQKRELDKLIATEEINKIKNRNKIT